MGFVEGVCVHRYEQVRIQLTGFYQSMRQGDIIISIAGEGGAHIRLPVYLFFELPGDGQSDVLLPGTAPAYRSRILPTMPRINGDGDETDHFRPVFPCCFTV